MQKPFPGTITSFAAQARKRTHLGERINVSIDDKFSFAIDLLLFEKHQLQRGSVIDAEFLEQLIEEDGDARAYARALHFLSYRPRSEGEIRKRLQRDEWPDEVIDRVLSRLRERGYVGDENFSAQWVESRNLFRPRGARALQHELRQKGVAREIIDEALPDAQQEAENAQAALRPKLRVWRNLEEAEQRQKALQFLARRGFGYGVSKTAWDRLREEDD